MIFRMSILKEKPGGINMVTYYTALGRMVMKEENETKIPIVVIDETEYQMSIDELIIWGSLHWNFLVKDTLEKEYSRRKAKNRIFNDTSFEQTLKRLETRGLVVSGTDYIAADALYGLIGKLKIRPVKFAISDKIRSMAYLYFVKGVTFSKCYESYFGTKFGPNEKNVLRLSRYVGITASEIIQCAEKDIKDIKSEDDVMDKLYCDRETTYETIVTQSRFSELKCDVINAVANLYLKKKIIFEN